MQRVHQDDLVGHVLGQEDWNLLKLQAIAEQINSSRSKPRRDGGPSVAARAKCYIPNASRAK